MAHINIHLGIHDRLDVEAVTTDGLVVPARSLVLRVGDDVSLFFRGTDAAGVRAARALAAALTAAADDLEIDLNTRAYLAQHPHTDKDS